GELGAARGAGGVRGGVGPFLVLGGADTADIDRAEVGVDAEPHRHDVGLGVGADGGEATERLALQVGDFGGGEDAHGCSPLSYSVAGVPSQRVRRSVSSTTLPSGSSR